MTRLRVIVNQESDKLDFIQKVLEDCPPLLVGRGKMGSDRFIFYSNIVQSSCYPFQCHRQHLAGQRTFRTIEAGLLSLTL